MREPESASSAEGEPVQKSKALLFLTLSILWIFPSLGAIWISAVNLPKILEAPNFFRALSLVKIEQWVALILLLTHGVFVFLAIRYRREEGRNIDFER